MAYPWRYGGYMAVYGAMLCGHGLRCGVREWRCVMACVCVCGVAGVRYGVAWRQAMAYMYAVGVADRWRWCMVCAGVRCGGVCVVVCGMALGVRVCSVWIRVIACVYVL